MSALQELFRLGGPVMYAIVALALVLYAQCFSLLVALWHVRLRRNRTEAGPGGAAASRARREALQGEFSERRVMLGAMIAAAPLLGLLGTVSGMVRIFGHLAVHAGERTMEGFAGGISEVLVATESGLVVAIPALGLVCLAHREVQQQLREPGEAVRTAAQKEAA